MNVIMQRIITTAVDDIERKAPTNTPSEASPPHNWKKKTSAQIKQKEGNIKCFFCYAMLLKFPFMLLDERKKDGNYSCHVNTNEQRFWGFT